MSLCPKRAGLTVHTVKGTQVDSCILNSLHLHILLALNRQVTYLQWTTADSAMTKVEWLMSMRAQRTISLKTTYLWAMVEVTSHTALSREIDQYLPRAGKKAGKIISVCSLITRGCENLWMNSQLTWQTEIRLPTQQHPIICIRNSDGWPLVSPLWSSQRHRVVGWYQRRSLQARTWHRYTGNKSNLVKVYKWNKKVRKVENNKKWSDTNISKHFSKNCVHQLMIQLTQQDVI